MKAGVLSLQGDFAEHRSILESLGVAVVPVRVPSDISGVDLLVLPGGESTTIGMLLESSGLAGPLGDALAQDMPVMGTCAGMILLASKILDGRADQRPYGRLDIAVRRNAYGRQVASFETDISVDGVEGGPVHAIFIRAPMVERCGPDVEVLARSPDGAPVVCRQANALVTSFHPELSGDDRLHRLFLARVR